MTLRIHEQGLEDLAERTRSWMSNTISSNDVVKKHCQRLGYKLALDGEFRIENPAISSFTAPRVKYTPSKNSLLYISTDGGEVEVKSMWSMNSRILALLKIQNVTGRAQGRIRGLASDISMTINDKNEFVQHQCVARFDDFNLMLTGSLAADILHWFNRPLAKALQSRVEETFCELMTELLIPWLRTQLERFPLKLQMEFSNEIRLVQSLRRIVTADGYLELRMTNLLVNRQGARVESIEEAQPPMNAETGESLTKPKVELFICEKTLQYLLIASHRSNLFVTNFTSPFLTTKCTLFCIGKLIPQIRSLPVISLFAVIRTNEAPTVHLLNQRIKLGTNISFEIYDEAFHELVMKVMAADHSTMKDAIQQSLSAEHHPSLENEKNLIGELSENYDQRKGMLEQKRKKRTFDVIYGEEEDETVLDEKNDAQFSQKIDDNFLNGYSAAKQKKSDSHMPVKKESDEESSDVEDPVYSFITQTPDGEEEAGGVFRKIVPWKVPDNNLPGPSRPASSKLIPHPRTQAGPDPIIENSKEWGFGQGQSGGSVIWPKLIAIQSTTVAEPYPSSNHPWTWTLAPAINVTRGPPPHPSYTAAPNVQAVLINIGKPILRIEIHSEVELEISLQNRRIHSEIKLSDVRAKLADSQIQDMSQRTIDLIVDTSVPFLENSVRIFYKDGVVMDELFQLPLKNATITVREHFIQLKSDFNLAEMID